MQICRKVLALMGTETVTAKCSK